MWYNNDGITYQDWEAIQLPGNLKTDTAVLN